MACQFVPFKHRQIMLRYSVLMRCRSVVLLMLVSATGAIWTRAAGQSTPDDTTIVERRGDLEFSLKVSPIPRVVGPIAMLTVSVRNAGDSAVSLYVDPCVPTVTGLPQTQNPYQIFAVCAAAPHTLTLDPGQGWSRWNGQSLDIPAGRYSLRSLITLKPEVWLGVDFTLAELLRSGCHYGWDRRLDARLEYLQKLVSDLDQATTRRSIGLPRMQRTRYSWLIVRKTVRGR